MNPLKRKPFYIFASLLLMLASFADAQIASWSPAGLSAYGPTPWAPTTTTTGVTVGGLTRGAGLATTGSPATNAWGAVNWAGAANQDATFTVSANPGYTVSFSTFNLSYRRSNTGPNTGTLEYTFGSSSTYTVIAALTSLTSTLTTGVPITPVNLSGVADLQNVPPGTVIRFRIFPTGGSSVGTFYVYGSAGMSLGGSVVSSGAAFTSTVTQTAAILCHGQAAASLSVTATGGTLPYTYSWSPSGGTADVASGLTAGVYTCVVTSASSATTMSTYTVTEPAALSATLSTQSNVSCFNGANGAATFTVNGGTQPYTYTWSPSGGNAAATTNLVAGNYTLAVSDANNCILSQSVAITQPAAATLTVVSSASAICNGSPVTLTATGANTYTWTGGVVNGAAFTPTSSASYTVSGTTAGGCTTTAVSSITVNALPVVNASASSSFSVCIGYPLTLTGTGANTYTWTGGISNGVAFTPTSSASYTVTGTTVNGCTNTAVASLTVNALPVVSASASPSVVICAGTLITLTGSGANTYTWTGGVVNGAAFAPTASASYTVTGTATNGCTNTAVSSLTVNALPALGASTSNATLCVGQTATLTASGALSYTWSTTQQTPAIAVSPTITTTYTLSGTNANGCIGRLAVLQSVSPCTGLEQLKASLSGIRFYPNPNNGSFIVQSDLDVDLSLLNSLGELVKKIQLNGGNDRRFRIEGLSQGIYFLVSQAGAQAVALKIVVTE
jgi:hypothetical protein